VTRDEYVRNVGWGLRDLPWSTRRDLLKELRGHLDELPTDSDYRAELGSPEAYASDLRTAAGLERRRGLAAFLRARRPRNLVLVVLVLTLIGLAIGAVVWIDSYQPIVFAGGTQLPPDSKPTPGAAGVTVVFRRGQQFEYGITIRNDDRFTVRVLGVLRGPADFFRGRLMMSKDQTGRGDNRPLERFHPFNMKPGSFRWLIFKGVLACTTGMGAGTGVTREEFPIRYRFLWRTATAEIPLDTPLSLTFPKDCPPPKNPSATP
jgi:hypothetical protein